MGHLAYVGVVAACLAGALWLEVAVRTHVLRRWRRLLLTLAPVLLVFVAWDAYAVSRRQWSFDPARTTGVVVVAGVPLDEVLFFAVVPVCALLSFEAVRAVRGWRAGDEGDQDGAA